MEWTVPSPEEPEFLIAASDAQSRAAFREHLVEMWLRLLATDEPEITVSVNLLDGSFEGPDVDNVTVMLNSAWVEQEYADLPADPEDDMEAFEELANAIHEEYVYLVADAFSDPRVQEVYANDGRPVFAQHHWDDDDTRRPLI